MLSTRIPPFMSFKHVMYVQYVSLYYCLYYRVFPSPTISSDLRMEGCESNIVTGNPERRRERTGKQEGSGSEDVAQNMYIAWWKHGRKRCNPLYKSRRLTWNKQYRTDSPTAQSFLQHWWSSEDIATHTLPGKVLSFALKTLREFAEFF